MNKRNIMLDLLKGFAIIFMILGHGIQLFNGSFYRTNSLYYDNSVYKIIYSFHMPLFMIISGYLFQISWNNGTKKLSKKLIHYFIPIITFSLLKSVNTFFILNVSVRVVISNILHTLWFLWALIWGSIIVVILEKSKKSSIILLIILFLFFLFSPDVLMSNVFKYTIPYFILGYFINKRKIKIISKRVEAFNFVIWFIMLLGYKREHFIYVSGISLYPKIKSLHDTMVQLFYIDIYRYFIGVSGCFAIYTIIKYLRKLIKESLIEKIIVELGKNTLGIYVLSTEIFNEIFYNFFRDETFSYLRSAVLSLIMIIICYTLTRLINKNSFFKFIILGEK